MVQPLKVLLTVPVAFFLWWSLHIAVLVGRVKLFDFKAKRNDLVEWWVVWAHSICPAAGTRWLERLHRCDWTMSAGRCS